MTSKQTGGSQKILIQRYRGNSHSQKHDRVVQEEPLELRVAGQTLTTTV
jgi:formate dehydrogenase assembly factor FdhD